ncbi:MAG TPA: carbon starvation protein A [Ignavibacteriaceae bacterium]|nr:carbon starvation protein A [Ignavibacteriaceae bacterium]
MESLLIMVLAFVGYLVMYKLYGKYIGNKIFAINDDNQVPSVEMEDGVDFVPTKKEVIFGHHFASIAGTGPIVGPAIAVIWGWVPALVWVFLGSIIMGAAHDFGSLIISMRNKGKSISEYTAKYINARTKYFFFFIVFLELWIIVAIFGLVMAVIFAMYPGAVLPVWLEIPIALYLGYAIYKKGGNLTAYTIIAVTIMYLTIILGAYVPVTLPAVLGISPIGNWSIILLIYAFIASVLPVGTLLQPRDYINGHELVVAMVLMVVGVMFASFSGNLHMVAPVYQAAPEAAPPLWPFLFITIACGAISGFHSLVSSGTSSKQVRKESDSIFVGYGGMLMEGALATLVIIATVAGIGMGYTTADGQTLFGVQAWTHHYASWAGAAGLGSKVGAFVDGAANMIGAIGVPKAVSVVLMGVFVASFAGTTLDTATRIQRYVLTEMFPRTFKNKFFSTAVVVLFALALIFSSGASGKGALSLWPLFGAVNQILASLTLIIIAIYLKQKNKKAWLISAIPAVFMFVMTFWAAIINQISFGSKNNILLQIVNVVIILSMVWVAGEGFIQLFRTKTSDFKDKNEPITENV